MLPLTVAINLIAVILIASGQVFPQAQLPAQRKRSEVQSSLPLTKFYDVVRPLPPGKAGDLIRSQSIEQYELPFSVDAVRILYHSRSATGEDVAASGVVLIPGERKPPAGGWPVIVWAHGAGGVARSCAPSLMRNLGHGPFLAMYVNLGYAVIAPDFTGLGTDFRNAFLDGPSNATDIISSIPAARAALPLLGKKWIVIGEAEGTLTAVAVAEKENEIRDAGYLGSLAISGLADAQELYESSALGSSSLMIASLAFGVKTVYPQFQVGDILTEKGLALYHRIEQSCSETGVGAALSPSETAKPDWRNNGFVRQYFARSRLAQTRAYGPIKLISSDTDPAIPQPVAAKTVARMCTLGDQVEWQRYSELDSGGLIGDSARDQIDWIEALFAGRAATTNCP